MVTSKRKIMRLVYTTWNSPRVVSTRTAVSRWRRASYSGTLVLLLGTALITLFILLVDRDVVLIPNPGLIYLPLVAMLAYHWGTRYAIIATVLELACTYLFFVLPGTLIKPLTPQSAAQLLTLAAVTLFMLAIVQLARERRSAAEREASRSAALYRVGSALASELDEDRLLHLIAETARGLTGAGFAAFTLRPVNELGQPLVPSEGNRFHLAAVVGVTDEQKQMFRRMQLGGEGLLAPIFRQGVPVLVDDALEYIHQSTQTPVGTGGEGERSGPAPLVSPEHAVLDAQRATPSGGRCGQDGSVPVPVQPAPPTDREKKSAARQAAFDFAHGQLSKEGLRSLGVPRGHPTVRSFLGAPLFDSNRQVIGGLLLGHAEPGRFTEEDEALLVGLAAQASISLENARLYHTAQMRAQELDAIFESITDGVTLVGFQGDILRENRSAHRLRELLKESPDGERATQALLHTPARGALQGEIEHDIDVTVSVKGKAGGTAGNGEDGGGPSRPPEEQREFLVNASPLRLPEPSSGILPVAPPFIEGPRSIEGVAASVLHEATNQSVSGAVVVWHDVTEARRLLVEQRAHAEAEAQRAFLQLVLDELPSSVYLVRGQDARLVLANRAAATMWGATWPTGQAMSQFLQENGIRIFGVDGHPLPPEELVTRRAVEHGETVRHHQEVIRHPDGTTLPVLVNAVALDAHSLNLSAIDGTQSSPEDPEPAAIVVHHDVTALKEAEKLKDEFIGIAAHELRSPLAVVKGFAQTLIVQTARGKGPELADWQMESLQGIDQATARLVELTEDLLDVTRLQAGRLALHFEPIDLVALVRRVVARLQMTTDQHTLSQHSTAEHLVADVDPRRIEQVLSNLIGNAIKYSPDGGHIEVALREDEQAGEAILCVSDHGIGIPEQQQPLVFGRFARADNARAHGISGTGLGLYLCRELVERHGGRIWFESIEGIGSTFFVALPLVTYPDL